MNVAAADPITFSLAGGAQPLILVPVFVNAGGPFSFILDTGAGTTLLTPKLAAALGVETGGVKKGHTAGGVVEVALGKADSIRVGPVRQDDIDIAIMPLDHLSAVVGASIDGDLGYNFLKPFRLTINYAQQTLRLDDPARCDDVGARALTEMPMRLANPSKPLILVVTHVNGRGPFQFAIDTGTSTTAISSDLERDLSLHSSPIGAVNTGGAQVQMTATRLSTLRVGGAERKDVDVIVGEFLSMLSDVVGTKLDGIIGYNFLRHFRVIIDYPGELLMLHQT